METPIIGIKDSKVVDEKIKNICVNFMKLMLDCMEDEKLREDFTKNTHDYLNNKVGMKIPKEVGIILDVKGARWPAIYVKEPDGDRIAIKEGAMGIEVTADLVSGIKQTTNWPLKKHEEIDVKIHASLKESNVVVVIPFFDASADVLGEYKFSDGHEIIMSCY